MAKYHNNFYFYFLEGWEQLRETPHYRKFASEHPDLATKLCEEVPQRLQTPAGRAMDTVDAIEPLCEDLDEAFNLMRKYGVSQKELEM